MFGAACLAMTALVVCRADSATPVSWHLCRDASKARRRSRRAYNRDMARGWESKSVEAQIEESKTTAAAGGHPLTAEEIQRRRKRAELELSRARVSQQLEASANPRYAEMLHLALADLERQIAEVID